MYWFPSSIFIRLFIVCLFLASCTDKVEPIKPPLLTVDIGFWLGTHNEFAADASVTYAGDNPITDHGIVYSAHENPILDNDRKQELGSIDPNDFHNQVYHYYYKFDGSDLMSDTEYYVKAYIKLNNQVYYSDEQKFRSLNGIWKKLASFPGPHRMFSLSFSVDEKLYLIGGKSIELHKFNDTWCYDPATNIWTEKSMFPLASITTEDAVSFVVNNIAYMVSSAGLWRYDPVNDLWEKIGNGINQVRMTAFSIFGKGYIHIQNGMLIYDPGTNTWTSTGNTEASQYPGDATYLKYAFSANGKGYSGFGLDRWQSFSPTTEFYEYDPVSNMWSEKESFLYYNNPKTGLTTFCLRNKIYVGMGRNTNDSVFGDLHEYDPITSTWNNVASLPGIERTDAFSCATSNKGYVGLGFKYYQGGQVDKLFDFWEFKP